MPWSGPASDQPSGAQQQQHQQLLHKLLQHHSTNQQQQQAPVAGSHLLQATPASQLEQQQQQQQPPHQAPASGNQLLWTQPYLSTPGGASSSPHQQLLMQDQQQQVGQSPTNPYRSPSSQFEMVNQLALKMPQNPGPSDYSPGALLWYSLMQPKRHTPRAYLKHPSASRKQHQQQHQQQPFFAAPSSSRATRCNLVGPQATGADLFASGGSSPASQQVAAGGNPGERFSRKVFVGGLPPDIDEEEIRASFQRFGALQVDWPHKVESKSYFPPKGYAFLLFHEEPAVQALIDACIQEHDKLYLSVSSPTIKDKPVQIRPWRLADADFVLDSTLALDPRKTVFVGGVPRPLKASELASVMNNFYGNVCYAGIDTDPELRYPKGAGRVAFSNHHSYISAISARFLHLQLGELERRVEVKPYVLDDQLCDECQGARCAHRFAPLFCAQVTCLRYYCQSCWTSVHGQPGKEFHKPLVKEGAERARGQPRWSVADL